MCEYCDLFIRSSGETFSVVVTARKGVPIPAGELIPEDAKIFTFALKSQAREWFHRKQWQRVRFEEKSEEQLSLNDEEKRLVEFHSEIRERIDLKKGEMERLLRSGIIKNITQGLEIYGYKITPEREIIKIGSANDDEPFCGLGGVVGEGIDRATDMIAMFELYLEYVHVQEIREQRKQAPAPRERRSRELKPGEDQEKALEVIKRVIKSVEDPKDPEDNNKQGGKLASEALDKKVLPNGER
jgi:hypothetical protein